MKLYFRLESIPELRDMTRTDRRRVVRYYRRHRSFRSSQWFKSAEYAAFGCLICLTSPILILLLSLIQASNTARLVVLSAAILIAIIIRQMAICSNRRELCRYLMDVRRPDGRLKECLDCDYDLRGSVSDTCSECGASVVLRREVQNDLE